MYTLPIYIAKIESNEDGIYAISLVDSPAIEAGFQKFKKEQLQMSITDPDKHIILGPIMRANMPIYRYSKELGEFYIKYTPEVILKMSEKLLSDNTFNNISLEHNGVNISGVKLMQLFIKDSTKGIVPNGFDDIEDGSLFAEYKIEDEQLWNDIKLGKFYGFSLEGNFTIVKEQRTEQNIKQKNTLYRKMIKNMLKFMKALIKLGSVKTDKETLYWLGDEDLKEGTEVFVDNEDNEPAADGEYVTEDGKVITVKEGKVESIVDPKAEAEPEGDKFEDEKPAAPAEPAQDLKAEVDALKTKVDELTAKYDALAEKLTKIEQTPAEKPIDEQFSKIAGIGGKIELVY